MKEWSKELYLKVNKPFVDLCIKNGVTANDITLFNHFLTLTFGCYFFSRGTLIGNVSGLGVMLICGFLDYLDGDVARKRKENSKLGEWLDTGFDVIIQNAIMGAISVGCFRSGLSIWWVVLFFIANSGNNLVSFNYNQTFGFKSVSGNELFRDFMDKKRTIINIIFKNIIDPTASWIGLVILTFRYWIVFGVVSNKMSVMFIIITLISNFKWIIMFVLYALHQKESKKLYVLQGLNFLDEERKDFYEIRQKRKQVLG
jgi:hypothetical protein